MSGEIRVTVCRWGKGRPLMLRWTDPISGKRKTKTSGTTNQRKAERLAGELERELQAGSTLIPSRIAWAQFRERFEREKLAGMPDSTAAQYRAALNHVTRVLDPDRLCKLTTQAMSGFVAKLRQEGVKPSTLAKTLRHIKAALRWAEKQGYLSKAPVIEMPKTGARMKGRAIATEEYERMLAAVPKVRPHDPEPWRRLLTGLWLSGLRIGEAVTLDWSEGPFQLDTTGRHPAFRIEAAGQKSGRAEYAPMTPDFATWILENTPEGERVGPVFKLVGRVSKRPMDPREVGRVVSAIGKAAKVVVNKAEGKYASAHDLRRAFGTRWARRVMPAVLQRLMRHVHISTTMDFYVDLDAATVADELWSGWGETDGHRPVRGNISGNSGPESSGANRRNSLAEAGFEPARGGRPTGF